MITFKNFNLSRLLSQQVAPVLFRWGTTGKQRFSHPFWMYKRRRRRAAISLLFNDYRRVAIHEIE